MNHIAIVVKCNVVKDLSNFFKQFSSFSWTSQTKSPLFNTAINIHLTLGSMTSDGSVLPYENIISCRSIHSYHNTSLSSNRVVRSR